MSVRVPPNYHAVELLEKLVLLFEPEQEFTFQTMKERGITVHQGKMQSLRNSKLVRRIRKDRRHGVSFGVYCIPTEVHHKTLQRVLKHVRSVVDDD